MLWSPNSLNAHTLKLLNNAAFPNHVNLLIKLLALQVGSSGISCSIYFLLQAFPGSMSYLPYEPLRIRTPSHQGAHFTCCPSSRITYQRSFKAQSLAFLKIRLPAQRRIIGHKINLLPLYLCIVYTDYRYLWSMIMHATGPSCMLLVHDLIFQLRTK